MRISAIAQEAIIRGHECRFVGRITDLAWVEEYVRTLGFKSLNQDIDNSDTIFQDEILVVDSYTIALDSPFNNPKIWKLVVCVTDHFTPQYSADIYINQSMFKVSTVESRGVLDGPDYALIRKGIKKVINYSTLQFPPRILILGGGSDPFGFVREVLHKLSNSELLFVTHVFSDENLSSFSSLSIHQHSLGPELDAIADSIDLVITTASTSSIEFIAREIPTLIACAVDNQEKLYFDLINLGLAIPIGKRNSTGDWRLDLKAIEVAVRDEGVRLNLRQKIQGYVDLMGPSRILDKIEKRIAEERSGLV